MQDTKELRSEVRRHGPSRRGRKFSAELRERLVGAVRALHAQGARFQEIGTQLGISEETARRYAERGAERGTRMRPVELEASVGREHALSVVTPSGIRAEGLSVAETAALLRLLSS